MSTIVYRMSALVVLENSNMAKLASPQYLSVHSFTGGLL